MTQFTKKHLIVGVVVGIACIAAVAFGVFHYTSGEASSSSSAESPASRSVVASGTRSGVSYRVATGHEKPPHCLEVPNPGECRGAFPRFFYNETLDQCDCFLYGGCGKEALQSSWLTHAECTSICSPGNTQEGPRCKHRPKQDIETFTQPSTLESLDTSNLSDTQLIDQLSNSFGGNTT